MTSMTNPRSRQPIGRQSNAQRLNAAGLLLTAAAMLLQIAGGSTLHPSLTGPIVLVVMALAVTLLPSRWTAYAGLAIPLVLGVGAIVAAAMTGGFVDQLADSGNPGVFLGSVLHLVGLAVAVAGGVGTVLRGRVAAHGR